jgi:hypothetical protein
MSKSLTEISSYVQKIYKEHQKKMERKEAKKEELEQQILF